MYRTFSYLYRIGKGGYKVFHTGIPELVADRKVETPWTISGFPQGSQTRSQGGSRFYVGRILPSIQVVVTLLYSKLQYKMGHYFLDI